MSDIEIPGVAATTENSGTTAKTWMFASIAIALVSSIGLLAVVVVPILQRINYRFVLHFFIALAIGALSGDSMLHLLPHALYESELAGVRERLLHHLQQVDPYFDEKSVEESSWEKIASSRDILTKGLIALCGLLLFFLSQRAMLVYGDLTKERKRPCDVGDEPNVVTPLRDKDKRASNCEPASKLDEVRSTGGDGNNEAFEPVSKVIVCVDQSAIDDAAVKVSTSCGERLTDAQSCTASNKRYSLRDPAYTPDRRPSAARSERRASSTKSERRPSNIIMVDADGDDVEKNDVALLTLHQLGTLPPRRSMQIEDRLDISTPLSRDNLACAFGVDDRDAEAFSEHRRPSHPRTPGGSRRPSGQRRSQALPSVSEVQEEHYTRGRQQQPDGNNGNGNGNGNGVDNDDDDYENDHSHAVPHDVRSLITMVILGDGMHNFTDGLAVGVAFAGSIPGGISTAVAVFCHELPHELGDFAVLLKSGLTLKMALLFNLMSSILSFFGMILGLLIGNSKNATQWVYCLVAGMFLYIALVNMLPELNPGWGQRSLLKLSLVQLLGLIIGIVIMFLISYFEDDIKSSNIFGLNETSDE